MPQLGSPRFPSLFVLPKFRVRLVGLLKEQAAPLVFNRSIEHFLERPVGLFRHLREAPVRCGTDTDCCCHTNVYAPPYAQLSTNKKTINRQSSVAGTTEHRISSIQHLALSIVVCQQQSLSTIDSQLLAMPKSRDCGAKARLPRRLACLAVTQ
jgi:hypothetical protein